jgi:rubrerythrin
MSKSERPNFAAITETLSQFLQLVSLEQRPLFVAMAERLAAERYRGWAGEVTDAAQRSGLMACADREEEIARRVESLYPDAAAIQADIITKIPNLPELSQALFDPYSLHDQLSLQAQGERLGATTWRSLAGKIEDPNAAEILLGCARLEEESAEFLDSMLER